MSDLLGSSFYAGLAGRNADQANANLQAANAAVDRADRNARIAKEWQATSRRNKAIADDWMNYARNLEGKVKKWQADAVESEAAARAAIEVTRMQNNGAGPRTVMGAEQYDGLKAQKVEEVCQEWQIENPFKG
jgi:hypothetical protein